MANNPCVLTYVVTTETDPVPIDVMGGMLMIAGASLTRGTMGLGGR